MSDVFKLPDEAVLVRPSAVHRSDTVLLMRSGESPAKASISTLDVIEWMKALTFDRFTGSKSRTVVFSGGRCGDKSSSLTSRLINTAYNVPSSGVFSRLFSEVFT